MTTSSPPRRRSLLMWIGGGALALGVLLTIPLKLIEDDGTTGAIWAIQMVSLLLGVCLVAAAVIRHAVRRRGRGVVA